MMKLAGLIPMLETPDLRRTIEFYTRVLGFELEASWPAPATRPGVAWFRARRS